MGKWFGGINSHLAETKAAVTKWLEHEDKSSNMVGGKDAALFALSLENSEEEPEQPEVLYILRQSRFFNIPIFNGSYYDWPYISTLEYKVCIEAENEYQSRLAANLRLQLEKQKHANPTLQ